MPREGLTKSEHQLLQFLALAQPTGSEHTNVALDPTEVLRQTGVSVSREFNFEPALYDGVPMPFTLETVGSDGDFQDCASPTASASGQVGACFD